MQDKILISITVSLLGVSLSQAQVTDHIKISAVESGFGTTLNDDSHFGAALAHLSDLDGDSAVEVVVGASKEDNDMGSVRVLFLTRDGTVKRHHRIGSGLGGFGGLLEQGDLFGTSIANVGDINMDGTDDLAVGATGTRSKGASTGAVWLLFMNSKGLVEDYTKIGILEGGFTGELDVNDQFGYSVAGIGDLDADGVQDLAVGAIGDNDGGVASGAVWLLFLNHDGTVKGSHKIGAGQGGFKGELSPLDEFGTSLTWLGKCDENLQVLAVGAPRDDSTGVVWLLHLEANGTVREHQKISATDGNFAGRLNAGDSFGSSVACLPDLNLDGTAEIVVGAQDSDDGGIDRGAVWLLFMDPNLTVREHQRISAVSGGDSTPTLDNGDGFGKSVLSVDLDADGRSEIVVGAWQDDDGGGEGSERGAVWVFHLTGDGLVDGLAKISDEVGGLSASLRRRDLFGRSVVSADIDGDNVWDLVVGSPGDDAGGEASGAVWLLGLNQDRTVRTTQKVKLESGEAGVQFGAAVTRLDVNGDGISEILVGAPGFVETEGERRAIPGDVYLLWLDENGVVNELQRIGESGFGGALEHFDLFGSSLSGIGDLNFDGIEDVAVGAVGDDDGGAVWILFLDANGVVVQEEKISPVLSGMDVRSEDLFGASIIGISDVDGDNIQDLVVGAPGDDDGGVDSGCVWLLFLNRDGTVKDHRKISATHGTLRGVLAEGARFGFSVTGLDDFDEDGVPEIAVGADGDGGEGAVWLLYLNQGGSVKRHEKIGTNLGGFSASLDSGDRFGSSVGITKIDDDELLDLIVGSVGDDDGGTDRGAVWLLTLNARPTVGEPMVTPSRPSVDEETTISSTISDNRSVSSAFLHFREAGDETFLFSPMGRLDGSETSGRWSGKIPGVFAGDRGIEFFLDAIDGDAARGRLPESGFFSIRVDVPGEGVTNIQNQPHGSDQSAYRLLSFPLDLENSLANSVLEDDLGPYDDTKWRMFEWSATDSLIEFSGTSTISVGEAFYLIVKEPGKRIDSGPGRTVRTDSLFAIPLEPGWTLFGSPFNFKIPVTDLERASPEQKLHLRFLNGNWQDLADSTIRPFEGYAVANNPLKSLPEVDTLIIDPSRGESRPASLTKREISWSVGIQAYAEASRDLDNFAIVAHGASNGWDWYDRPEPPSVGDFVSVYFPHPEWDRVISSYSSDARPWNQEGVTWDFVVQSSAHELVDLRFTGLEEMPGELDVWLFDELTRQLQDIRRLSTYQMAGTGRPRLLRLIISGEGGFVEERVGEHGHSQKSVELSSFPNPFSKTITILYALQNDEEVSITILNTLGQVVAELESGTWKKAGRNVVLWDGEDLTGRRVASGVYFVLLRAASFVRSIPVVLVK